MRPRQWYKRRRDDSDAEEALIPGAPSWGVPPPFVGCRVVYGLGVFQAGPVTSCPSNLPGLPPDDALDPSASLVNAGAGCRVGGTQGRPAPLAAAAVTEATAVAAVLGFRLVPVPRAGELFHKGTTMHNN